MALTLQQIIQRTPKLRKENARFVKLTKLTTGYWPKGGPYAGLGYVAAQSYSTATVDAYGRKTPNTDRQKYVTVVTFLDQKLNVHCSCSCADFKFRWEAALKNRGAAVIEYSNGEMPDITNPSYRPATCKHLVALYERVKGKLG